MKHMIVTAMLAAGSTSLSFAAREPRPATSVLEWSNEARKAIVPAAPNGVFGSENYGTKFPGEAAVYLGMVHAAIFDVLVAIDGGYQPYAIDVKAPRGTSPDAAVATAAHHVLTGILDPPQRAVLDVRYAAYVDALEDTAAKKNGVAIGERVAAALLARRTDDGREKNPTVDDLDPPDPVPGVWDPGPTPAVGLRMPGLRPLALRRARQFRPAGPPALASVEYARDLKQVAALGRGDSDVRRPEETAQALFWTDHDLRQWNDGLLALAVARRLDRLETARMLALAHVAGGDAMIACFDAKYAFWFWRPYQAVPRADEDGNPRTTAEPRWAPLRTTPNFPEYPSAHACHSSGVVTALQFFFGTDRIRLSFDSRATGTSRTYERLHDVVTDVNRARVLVGFHFLRSDHDGARLGRRVAEYVIAHQFKPVAHQHDHDRERTEP